MVSDFITQNTGFLQLNDQQYNIAREHRSNFPQTARVLLEYGADKEGYWPGGKIHVIKPKHAEFYALFRMNLARFLVCYRPVHAKNRIIMPLR